MSLYYDAAPLLVSAPDAAGSLKSRVFSYKDLKSPPKQIFALVSEASKWSPVLVDVIEKSQLLQLERKLSPNLALLLVHDLLLVKRGVSAPTSHPLRLAVERHKARLHAELTKVRLKRGFVSIEDLRANIEMGDAWLDHSNEKQSTHESDDSVLIGQWAHPRWVRINSLKTTVHDQLRTTFVGYKKVDSLVQLLRGASNASSKLLYVDSNIPNLLALSAATDISKTPAYFNGLLIFQDKASCFPAYLLDPDPADGDVIDACAAPGNKTTHLAAILREKSGTVRNERIYACERDAVRAATLDQMVHIAGAGDVTTIRKGQDFLRLNPNSSPGSDVGSLLLDPSCSGSGIVERDQSLRVVLPSKRPTDSFEAQSKKRKRKADLSTQPILQAQREEIPISESKQPDQLAARLTALSTFQLKLLLHAFQFPKARRLTYSTCSIYAEENEHVVMKALDSSIAKQHGWRILRRNDQISGMKAWGIRGDAQACKVVAASVCPEEVAEACIRCEKGTQEGTQGFFVAAFVRDFDSGVKEQLLEEEWEGFADDGSDS